MFVCMLRLDVVVINDFLKLRRTMQCKCLKIAGSKQHKKSSTDIENRNTGGYAVQRRLSSLPLLSFFLYLLCSRRQYALLKGLPNGAQLIPVFRWFLLKRVVKSAPSRRTCEKHPQLPKVFNKQKEAEVVFLFDILNDVA